MEEKTVLLPLEINENIDIIQFLNHLIQLPIEMQKEATVNNKLLTPNEQLIMFRCAVKVFRILQPQQRFFDTIDVLYVYNLDKLGFSMQDIADVLDRSKSSVCEYLNKIK
jgi:hypothetical protein